MLYAQSVYNLEIKLLQLLQPSCHLAFGVFHIAQPCEGTMVRQEGEMLAKKVCTEMLSKGHNGQEFLPSNTVLH